MMVVTKRLVFASGDWAVADDMGRWTPSSKSHTHTHTDARCAHLLCWRGNVYFKHCPTDKQ